ncbi:MAG TPA: hypothetical protein VFO55_12195 [Gemmatimonadaceae bacterium]|nr:hypothetical protein [Gemmatimonadaceae bacterium]
MRAATARWVRLALMLAVVAGVVAAFSMWQAYRTARSELSESRCDGYTTFVQSQWMDTTLSLGRAAVRGCMVDDLLARHPLRGKTRAEVVALIGEPTEKELFREYDMVYWLGPERGLIGTDSEFLVIRLDAAGRVTTVELVTG